MILTTSPYVSGADLPVQITGTEELPKHSDDLRTAMASYEKLHIQRVLQATGGNKEQSARHLGINPSTLYRKMADLGLTDRTGS